MAVTIYPTPGRWLPGHPTTVREIETKAEAEALVKTGVYQFKEDCEFCGPPPCPHSWISPEPAPKKSSKE